MMRISWKSAVLAVALGGQLLVSGCGSSPEESVKSAKAYLDKKDSASAVVELKHALSKHPNLAEARYLLASALLVGGDAVAAEIEARKAIELGYDKNAGTLVLAKAMQQKGQAREALAVLKAIDEARAPAETAYEASIIRGNAHASLRELNAARAAFEGALGRNADAVEASLGLARLQAIEGNPDEALRIVETVIGKHDNDADVWQLKADLLRAVRKDEDALAAYRKVVALRPKSVVAHGAIIMALLRGKQTDKATEQFEQMEKAAPKAPLTSYMRGLVAFAKRDFDGARKSVEALLKVQPDNAFALQLAGLIAYETRADIQAQEFLAKALQKSPALEFGRRALVLSYLRTAQPDKAIDALEPALKAGKAANVWLALAGDAHLQKGDAKTAAEFFRKTAEADPGNVRARTALAMANMRLGSVDQAFADLERIASDDRSTIADNALIASALSQGKFDKALAAIEYMQKKLPDSPVPHHLRGTALAGKKDTTGARAAFEKAVGINPAFLPAAASLAQMDLAEKKPDDARKRFEAVLAKDPKNSSAVLALAEIKAKAGGTPAEVTSLIEKAVAIAPNESVPRKALIAHLVRTENKEAALKAVNEALATVPDHPDLLEMAAQVYRATGDLNQAQSTYEKVIALRPNAEQPYLQLAETQIAAKNKESARGTLSKGLSAFPDSLPIQRAAIMMDVADGRFEESVRRAIGIQHKHPKHPAGYVLEGDVRLAQKAFDKAIAAYAAGLKATPTTDLAERHHSALLVAGKRSDADQAAASWKRAYPKDNAFRLYLADRALQAKEYKVAAAQYREMLAAEPKNPMLLNNLAWTLGEMGDPGALSMSEEANRLAPNQPAILDTYGTLLTKSGKSAEGLDLLAKALKMAPGSSAIRLNYARALVAAGKKAEARKELEVLAKLGKQFPQHEEVAKLLQSP